MKWRCRKDEGFGSEMELRIGWLNINFSRYGNHIYMHLIWAEPGKPVPKETR